MPCRSAFRFPLPFLPSLPCILLTALPPPFPAPLLPPLHTQIGDHKQLRPKVECYSLSVESGHGHDLNVSLFERLAVGGFPHVTLGVQHRMHPEISAIVRSCTYPQLQDHVSVQQHPPLLGVQGGRRLLFLDHDVPEEQEKAGWGNYSFKSKASDGVWVSWRWVVGSP